MTGAVPYVPVDDLQAALARLRDAGAEERQPPTDVGGGRLIALVADADGNVTGLMQDT
jgi:predicted enzyme related to lactoylglutathione lyase